MLPSPVSPSSANRPRTGLLLAVSAGILALLFACGGASNAPGSTASGTAPVTSITAPTSVTGAQAGYAASVPTQAGCTYTWTVTNGAIMVGAGTDSIAFTPGATGTVTLSCKVTSGTGVSATGTASATITAATPPPFNLDQCLSDGAQTSTIAFSGFGMMTGNLGAQSFFPPGKVADYWGFQCLRDNDTSDMGHNTSFLTRVSSNMLYVLNDTQVAALKSLASSQVANINLYAWKRYPLMKSFRLMLDGTLPSGTTGLSVDAVKSASRDLYLLDGQLSYERAVVYADLYRSFTADQKRYLGAMVGKPYSGWPDKTEADVAAKTQGLTNDEVVAMMTYAGDLYAWYAGSVTSDVYFCPERHGTYFGSFYLKDAPAVNHPDYSIDETMTATIGRALCDSTQGYISAAGAAKMNALADTQRANLYSNASANIVLARQKISEALRSLITSTAPSAADLAQVQSTVATWSGVYGDLDGENNHAYATTFAELYRNVGGSYLTSSQLTGLAALRKAAMTVTENGALVDYSACTKQFLFAAEVPLTSTDFISYTSSAVTGPLFK